MNYTGYSVLKVTKDDGAYAYGLKAYSLATGATGVGGYLNSYAGSSIDFVHGITSGNYPLPTGGLQPSDFVYTGEASIIGGATPNGDIRGEATGFSRFGTTTPYSLEKNTQYSGALYAVYTVSPTVSHYQKIGIGTTSTDISTSGYYEGSFTTHQIYEFESTYNADLDDPTKIITGSGVYTNGGDVSLQFNILNRNGELLTSAAQIASDPFVDRQIISILDSNANVVFPNYRTNGDSTFTFSRSQNIDVFGSYNRNFGIRNEIVNKDGGITTGEFYLYANTATFDGVIVQASGETSLNQNLSNHSPPETGTITSASDRADAIKYFNNQPINTSGSTGFIELTLNFNESPNFTNLGDVTIWKGTSEDFVTNRGSLVGNYPLNLIQEGQKITLTANDGIEEATPLFFKLIADSDVGFEPEILTIGPYTLEPNVEGPDLNLYNQGDQSLVGDFTIEGGLEGDSSNGGNLNVSGNALGTGIGGRLTGPESKMYLLSGDAGTEPDTLQTVTARGNTTLGLDVNFQDGTLFVDHTNQRVGVGTNIPQDTLEVVGHSFFDGDVGIGTANPSSKLEVVGTNAQVEIATTDGYSIKSSQKAIIAGVGIGTISSKGSMIAGGSGHHISGDYDTIAGGTINNISGGNFNFIGGGSQIDITGSQYSSSVGGKNNDLFNSDYSVIGGGQNNKIEESNGSFIGGGFDNLNQANFSAIGGGTLNKTTGNGYSFIGGGEGNEVHSVFGGILAGENNIVSGDDSAIVGSSQSKVFGVHSLIAGGKDSVSSGDYSFTLGRQALIPSSHDGAAVFADGQSRDHISSGAHTATLDFDGGVYVPTSGMFGQGLFVSGVPVLTGEINPPEVDTLQTVTTRGNETTTSIISTGPYISGVTGLFSNNVGIGTTSPDKKLTVASNGVSDGFKLETSSGNTYATLTNANSETFPVGSFNMNWGSNNTFRAGVNNNEGYVRGGSNTNGKLVLQAYQTDVATIRDHGLGIFQDNPSYTLDVSGSGHFVNDLIIDGSTLGTGDGNRITNNGVPYLLSGDSPAETQTLQDVTDNGNTTTNDIITSGDVQADEFIGDLRGAVSFRAKAAEALSAGEVVFISGIDGNTTVVAKADANDPTRMPAFGVSKETVNANANVRIVNFGSVSNINTSSYSEGDELFVSNTAGLLTGIAPTGESSALQKMAKVTRSHASAGSITVMGAGRTNAVPNLNEGNLFVGDSNNQAVADDTAYVDIANSRVGIGTTSPQSPLHVEDAGGSGVRVSRTGNPAYLQLFPAYSSVPTIMGQGIGGLHLGYQSNTAGIRIDTSNNVGIGTTSPSVPLHLYSAEAQMNFESSHGRTSSIYQGGGNFHIRASHSNGVAINYADSNAALLNLYNSTTAAVSLRANGFSYFNGGNVGIGTTSPSEKLDIRGGDLQIYNSYASGVQIKMAHYDPAAGTTYDSSIIKSVLDAISPQDAGSSMLRFYTNKNSTTSSTVALDLTKDQNAIFYGNVGIGTTSPTAPLTFGKSVYGGTSSENFFRIKFKDNGGIQNDVGIGQSDVNSLEFNKCPAGIFSFNDGTNGEVMRINSNGNVGIGTTNPTEKLEVAPDSDVSAIIGRAHIGKAAPNDFATFSHVDHASSTNYALNQNQHGDTKLNYANGRSLSFRRTNVEIGGFNASADFFVDTDTLYVDSSTDRVGIGTTSPVDALDVKYSNPRVRLIDTTVPNDPVAYMWNSEGSLLFRADVTQVRLNTYIRFDIDQSEKLRIIDNGNVGIGTTNPSDNLTVEGGGITLGGTGRIQGVDTVTDATDAANKAYVDAQVGASDTLQEVTDNGNTTTNSIGIGTTSPSAKLHVQSPDETVLRIERTSGSGYTALDIKDGVGTTGNSAIRFSDTAGSAGQIEYEHADNSMRFSTNTAGSEKMRIESSGNVGIGTTNPSAALTIKGSANDSTFRLNSFSGSGYIDALMGNTPYFRLYQSNGNRLQIGAGDGNINRFNSSNTAIDLSFATNGGNVGIGTTSPAYKLDVNGEVRSDAYRIDLSATTQRALSSTGTDSLQVGDAGVNDIKFKNAAGNSVIIASSGNVGIGTTAPATILDIDDGTLSDIRIRGNATTDVRFAGIAFYNTAGSDVVAAVNVDRDGANDAGALTFDTQPAGGGNTERLRISSTGAIKFNNYGAGTFTGTVTQKLGVDSSGNVIEMPIGAGPVDGSGTANYLARWIDSDTLGIGATYDNGTNVGIGTTNPAKKLHVLNSTNEAQIRLGQSGSGSYDLGVYANDTFSIGRDADTQEFNIKSGNVGIGTTSPATKLHILTSNEGAKTTYADVAIEAVDAQLDLTSSSSGSWGSAINFVEGASTSANTDIWSIARQTTGGAGDSSLRFNFGTSNQHDNDNKVTFTSSGKVGIGTDSPDQNLEVVGQAIIDGGVGVNSSGTLHLRQKGNSASDGLAITSSHSTSHRIWKDASGKLNIGPSSDSDAFVQDLSGNVGIGTTTPSYKLDVNGTLRATSAAYFNNDVVVTNNLILTGANKPTFSTPDDTVYTPSNNWVTATPFNAAWHDLIAFDRNYTTAQEISTDGTNFSSDTLELGLFDQKDKTKYEVVGSGERAVRWTWTGVAYSVGRYFHIAAGYSSPAPSCTVKIETSSDGSTWTEIHSSSGISFSATNRFYYVDPYIGNGGHNYVRLTIDKGNTDTKTINLTSIKMLTQRLGDQGQGREDELPFYYDKNQNIGIGTTSPDNKLEVVGPYSATPFKVLRHGDYGNVIQIGRNGVSETANIGYPADSTINLSTNGTERMRINSSGNVGIGTTAPNSNLHVYAASNAPTFRISRASNGQVWTQTIDSSARFLLQEAASEGGTLNTRLSIDDAGETLLCMNGGSCGIGTVSVNQNGSKTTLDIHHATVGAAIRLRQGSNSALIRYDDTDGLQVGTIASKNLSFETADTTAITIDTSQNVGIATTTPQRKLDVALSGNSGVDASFGGLISVGEYQGIHFGYSETANNLYRKSAIVFERTDSTSNNAQGKIHILNGPQTGSASATLSDAKLTIAEDGNVGIGTTSPAEKLHVIGGSASALNTQYPAAIFQASDAYTGNSGLVTIGGYWDNTNANLRRGYIQASNSTGSVSYLLLNPNGGNVGIGTTNPAKKLDVVGNAGISGQLLLNSPSYNDHLAIRRGSYGYDTIVTGSRVDYSPTTATDTFKFLADLQTTGDLAVSGNATVSGGGITLGGTGRIQGVDTVTDATDAANKAYVDAQVGSADTLQEVTDNGATTTNSIFIHNSSTTVNPRLSVGRDGSQSIQFSVTDTINTIQANQDADSDSDHKFILNRSFSGSGENDFEIQKGGSPQLTIDTIGNVGIGTTNPSQKLTVEGNIELGTGGYIYGDTTTPNLRLSNAAGALLQYGTSSLQNGGSLQFVTTSGTVFRVNSGGGGYFNGGNVGIGTTSPSSKLEVVEATANTAARITVDSASWDASLSLKNANGTWEILNDYTGAGTTGALAFWNGSYRMVIDNTGNVGIGTTSPSEKLEVGGNLKIASIGTGNSASSYDLLFYGTTSSGTQTDQAAIHTSPWSTNTNGGNLIFETSNTSNALAERMRIDGAGNVGIGTTNPSTKLQVAGTSQFDGDLNVANSTLSITAAAPNMLFIVPSGGLDSRIFNDGSGNFIIGHGNNSNTPTERLRIDSSGNVGIGTTSPDYELHVIGTASFTDTVAGAYFEENASNPELKELDTGTILVMDEEGEIVPSCKANDTMVFGASKRGYKQPIVMGAEPIKMTGPIKVGDFITTSSKYGHGMRSETKEVGTIIAQAMESGDGDSYNIKAMIRKM